MIKAVTLDLDGTIYLGTKPVDGAAEYVSFLRDNGIKYLFVTNRANRLPEVIAEQLNEMGIDCKPEDILTSSQATADYLDPAPAYIIGEIGLEKALMDRGFTLTEQAPKYVIVSYDRSFTYAKMHIACNLIYKGAQFIATNPDQCLRMEDGVHPGTGSIVAAIEAGCRQKAMVIGKPQPMILRVAAERMGTAPAETLAGGDNSDTDVPAGISAGMQSAIILTGLSTAEDVEKSDIKPHFTAQNYADLTEITRSLI